jgi:hypothetical protein
MRRRRPPVEQPPNDDWLARADQERAGRDAAFRRHQTTLIQEAAQRAAWRPQTEGPVRRMLRVLHGTRDR